jgi:hypothetical protein
MAPKDPKKLTEETRGAADATAELTEAINARTSAEGRLNRELSKQSSLSSSLNKALKDNTESLEKATGNSESFGASLQKNFKKSKSVTGAFAATLDQMADKMEKSGKKATFMIGALRGASKAFQLIGKAFSAVTSLAKKLIGDFIEINKKLIMAPLAMMDALMKAADEQAKASIPVAQASQDAAEEFGSNADKIRNMAGTFSDAEGKLGNKFGWMSGGQFKAATQSMSDMGNAVEALWERAGEAAEGLANMNMAMGWGAEEMSALGNVALATGQDMQQMMDENIQLSYAMADATGVTRKRISKDMIILQNSMATWGAISAQQATVISAKMRTLGMDFKTLGKMVDKFMNFDQAAESAAMLGQAFGMAVNPMEMMQGAAGDQVKMLETMRKQFFATGKDVNQLNAAEMKLLMNSTGLSDAEARLMFSMENRGKSAKSLRKSAKSQMTDTQKQTKAMASMADEMARLVEVLTTGGMKENFFKGINDAMTESGDLSKFQDLNEAFYEAGKEMGAVINRLIQSGMFDTMINNLMKIGELVSGLGRPGGFFDMLFMGGGVGAMEELDRVFIDVFGSSFTSVLQTAGAYLINWAASMVETLASFLEGTLSQAGGTEAQNKLAEAFARLGSAWMRVFKALEPHLTALMSHIGGAMVDALWGWIQANPGKSIAIGVLLTTLMFGPAFIIGVAKMIGGALLAGAKAGAGAASAGLSRIMGRAARPAPGENGAGTTAPAGQPPGATGARSLGQRLAAFGRIKPRTILKAGRTLAMLAVMFTIGAVSFIGALWLTMKVYRAAALEEKETLLMMGLMGVTMLGAYGMFQLLKRAKIKPAEIKDVIMGSIALGVMMGILGGAFAAIVWMVSKAAGTNPSGVAAVMDSMAEIIGLTVLFLPVAAALGIMLMAWPFGTAGVAIIAAGFVILGSLGATLVRSFIPAIEAIAAIRIEDPASFEIVSKAIISLIETSGRFVGSIGEILAAAKPTDLDREKGITMSDNIAVVVDLVDAFMANGIVRLVDSLVQLAGMQVDQSAIDFLSGIGQILEGVGAMAASIGGAANADALASGNIDDDDSAKFVNAQREYAATMGPIVQGLMSTLSTTLLSPRFMNSLRGLVMGSGQTSMLGDIGPIISAAAGFASALQPGDAMKAMQHIDNDDSAKYVNALANYARTLGPVIVSMLPALQNLISGVMAQAGMYLDVVANTNLSEGQIQGAADLMTGIMMATSAGAQALSMTLQQMGNIMSSTMSEERKTELLEMLQTEGAEMFSRIGRAMSQDMGPAINQLMTGLDQIELVNPDQIEQKITIIAAMMEAISTAAGLFGRGGTMSSVTNTQMGAEVGSLLRSFADHILGNTGTIQYAVDKVQQMDLPSNVGGTVELALGIFQNVGEMVDGAMDFVAKTRTFDVGEIAGSKMKFENAMIEFSTFDFVNDEAISNMRTTLSNAETVKGVAEQLTTMLVSIAEIVNGIPEITLPIEVLGRSASLVEEFNEVKDRPISMTVTLNVSIDAEQMAVALKETDAMRGTATTGR